MVDMSGEVPMPTPEEIKLYRLYQAGNTSGEVPVQDNRLNIYKYLKELGRPPKEIAVIMGNIYGESETFDDQEVEKTESEDKGQGIFQLTKLKKRVYNKHIADKQLPDNYKTQIDFMLDTIYNPDNLSDGILEVKGMEGKKKHDVSGYGWMEDLRKSLIEDPVDVATKKFTDLWERPKKGHERYDKRINHAIDIFQNLTGPRLPRVHGGTMVRNYHE